MKGGDPLRSATVAHPAARIESNTTGLNIARSYCGSRLLTLEATISKTLRTVGIVLGAAALVAGTIATGGALGIVAAGVASAASTVATVASVGATLAGLASQ